jgi:hypothetical protein
VAGVNCHHTHGVNRRLAAYDSVLGHDTRRADMTQRAARSLVARHWMCGDEASDRPIRRQDSSRSCRGVMPSFVKTCRCGTRRCAGCERQRADLGVGDSVTRQPRDPALLAAGSSRVSVTRLWRCSPVASSSRSARPANAQARVVVSNPGAVRRCDPGVQAPAVAPATRAHEVGAGGLE